MPSVRLPHSVHQSWLYKCKKAMKGILFDSTTHEHIPSDSVDEKTDGIFFHKPIVYSENVLGRIHTHFNSRTTPSKLR